MACAPDSVTTPIARVSASQVNQGERRTTRKATPSTKTPKAARTARPPGDDSIQG